MLDASIAHYLAILADKDKQEYSAEDVTVMHEKVAWMKNRLTELADIEAKVNEHPDKQLSLTDPDLRLMKASNMVRQVCYNVQSAVDSQHHLIISHKVTQSADRGKLHLVATQVQEALESTNITFVADKGYYRRANIKNVFDPGAEMLVPKGDTSGAEKAGIFTKTNSNITG